MQNRLFYFNGNYARLHVDRFISMTPAEVENFCRINRETTLVAFIHPEEARDLPRFWTQTDLRIKQVRLDEDFRSMVLPMLDRELTGCYELVKAWLLGIDPSLISYTTQIPIV